VTRHPEAVDEGDGAATIGPATEQRPRLAIGVRLRHDAVRGQDTLLYPEGALVLNSTAAAILRLCDGRRMLGDIVGALTAQFDGAEVGADVEELLEQLRRIGLVVDADG
jgi:pyrroloquinoline quinone biosynthesis protein D